MLEKMEGTSKTTLKKVEEHSPLPVVDNVHQEVNNNQGEIGGSVIKGTKVKERVTYKYSKRSMNALEKAIRKGKCKAKQTFPIKVTQVILIAY